MKRYRQRQTAAGPVTVVRQGTGEVVRVEPAHGGAYYQPGKGSGVGPRVREGATQRNGDRRDPHRRHD